MDVTSHRSIGSHGIGGSGSLHSSSTEHTAPTFTSSVDGEMHTVTISSPGKKLTSDEVSVVKNSFIQQFGKEAASNAFRLIEQRVRDDEPITGAHILSAKLTAMEIISPGLRFASETLQAQEDVAKFTGDVNTAKKELAEAELRLKDAQKDIENSRDRFFGSSMMPGLRGPLDIANNDVGTAKGKLETAQNNLKDAEKRLSEGREKVKLFNQALDQPLERSDDQVKLGNRKNDLEKAVAKDQQTVDTASEKVTTLTESLKNKEKEYYDKYEGFGMINQSGLYGEIQKLKEELATAKNDLALAKRELQETREMLAGVNDRLTALTVGPHYRRAQQLMNNVGTDPRFLSILNDIAPGKATGGGLGTLESTFGSITDSLKPGAILETVVTSALPPAKVFNLFDKAIKKENCERYLNGSKDSMAKFPLAQGIAETLSKANELEKWKLGLQGTFAFVGTALTTSVPGGHSALGTLTDPITKQVTDFLTEKATHALGEIVGEGTMKLGETIVDTVRDKSIEKGQDKFVESHLEGMENEELRHMLAKMSVPDGTSMPVIPVKPFGEEHSLVRDLSLSDPQVAVALLTYLGPPQDTSMLNHSNTTIRENEERRIALRQEMFGALPDEDLTPGPTKNREGDKRLIEELDNKGNKGSTMHNVERASPLHLLCLGSGLLLQPRFG